MAYIEINKENYRHNIEALAKKAGGKDKVMVVLKDNAYGHDLELMAKLASSFGIKKCAVKSLMEARLIKLYFEEVLILADLPPKELEPRGICFGVHSLEGLHEYPVGSDIHLNIDSGMHRNGIQEWEIEEAFDVIVERKLNLKGVYTHFKSADDLGTTQFWQEENFKKYKVIAKEMIKKHNLPTPNFHTCNSAALLRRETAIEDDFARCGIAIYGYTHLEESFNKSDHKNHVELKPVMSLWAEKLCTKVLKKGDRVGYGGKGLVEEDGMVSMYDIGYGDGFFRHNGESKLVLEGQEVVGRISMDSLAMNGNAKQVCLFKDAHYLAGKFNTITYEVITKMMPYIRKVVV